MRSSELQRAAEQAENNKQRLTQWRQRHLKLYGVTPERDPANKGKRGRWRIYWMRQILRGKGPSNMAPSRETHGNGTVYKFPRRKGQIIGASLPTGPEAV